MNDFLGFGPSDGWDLLSPEQQNMLMDDLDPIKPDYDIIEEQPKDWFPFIMGVGMGICGFLFGVMLALR